MKSTAESLAWDGQYMGAACAWAHSAALQPPSGGEAGKWGTIFPIHLCTQSSRRKLSSTK